MPRGAANVVESRGEVAKLLRVRAFCLIALAACGAGAILSQGAAVPISQEHHHHLIIENSYIKAYEVEVPPHEATLLHQHDYDYVYVVFGDADITNAIEGKPMVSSHLPDTTVNFVKGPIAHIAGNVGDTPFRNITISLLHKQGEVKIFFPSIDAALEDAERMANVGGPQTILETQELRVNAYGVDRGGTWAPPKTGHARFVILPERMNDKTAPREKMAPTFPAGVMQWVGANQDWVFKNDLPHKAKVLWLEFKD